MTAVPWQPMVPLADAGLAGQAGSLEADAGSVDIDTVTLAGFYHFGIAGDDGDACLFCFFGDGRYDVPEIGKKKAFFQNKGKT